MGAEPREAEDAAVAVRIGNMIREAKCAWMRPRPETLASPDATTSSFEYQLLQVVQQVALGPTGA